MTGLAATVVALLVGALVAELRDVAGWLSPRMIRRAARRLPERLRADREEEWLAELASMTGLKFTPFLWSLGVAVAAARLSWRYREERASEDLAQLEKVVGGVSQLSRQYTRGVITREEYFGELLEQEEQSQVRLWRLRGEIKRGLGRRERHIKRRLWLTWWPPVHRIYVRWLVGRTRGFYRLYLAKKYGTSLREVGSVATPTELAAARVLYALGRPYRRYRTWTWWLASKRRAVSRSISVKRGSESAGS